MEQRSKADRLQNLWEEWRDGEMDDRIDLWIIDGWIIGWIIGWMIGWMDE
jgi:hypothetical protein